MQPRKAASLGDATPLDEAAPEVAIDRILARLVQAEAHAEDISQREEYRQSFITLSMARDGSPIPFVEGSYLMYGVHPDKLFDKLTERRKAQLGPEYSKFYDENGNQLPFRGSPKKPAASVRRKSDQAEGKLS